MDYVGYVDEVNRFYVAGWVADRNDWQRSLKIDVIVNGQGRGVCAADAFRKGLDELHPDATGRYAFRFYFAGPLSMYSKQEISVRVSGSTFYLAQKHGPILPIESNVPDTNASRYRPSGPAIVSTLGRTGSTAVMAILAQHPKIVVAGGRPFEVEMGCYYAYALRTLLANGDHERSLRTDEITATSNRFNIGFNPYFETSFSNVFNDTQGLQRYMTNRLPGRLSQAFREIILDYYEEVAKDHGKQGPVFFAEKSLPERDSRLGIRFMFPNAKEIVLVRDFRDVVCSSTSSNGIPFETVIEDTFAAALQLQAILVGDRSHTLVLKYEDIVKDNAGTKECLFRFLGLEPVVTDDSAMERLFATHATSANPDASIGRWKRDLTSEQKQRCEVFTPMLEAFGYAV